MKYFFLILIFIALIGCAKKQEAPQSSLSKDKAFYLANAIKLTDKSYKIYYVLDTNSMLPTFDSNCYLVVEPINNKKLNIGDIVTFKSQGKIKVHRIVDLNSSSVFISGDNAISDGWIQNENVLERIICVIYFEK